MSTNNREVAENTVSSLNSEEIFQHRVHLINEIRALSAVYAEFTYQFAVWLELHPTDAQALTEILFAEDLGQPLSPARLSEKISLSAGATTAALDRLEAAGYVERSKESSDRRIVTLRTTPAIRPPAIEFFKPLGEYVDRLVAQYDGEHIVSHETFMGNLRDNLQQALESQKSFPKRNNS